MDEKILKVKIKDNLKKNNNQLREQGWLPAVVYGRGFKNKVIAVRYSDFEKIYRQTDGTSLFDLVIEEEEPIKVIIADVQNDALSGKIVHIDFHQVRMDEKINTGIELEFINESPAVKNLGGILVKALDIIEVSCLPSDLISKIQVDLAQLIAIDSVIRVKDLALPNGLEVHTEPETVVALVEEQQKIIEETKPTGASVETDMAKQAETEKKSETETKRENK